MSYLRVMALSALNQETDALDDTHSFGAPRSKRIEGATPRPAKDQTQLANIEKAALRTAEQLQKIATKLDELKEETASTPSSAKIYRVAGDLRCLATALEQEFHPRGQTCSIDEMAAFTALSAISGLLHHLIREEIEENLLLSPDVYRFLGVVKPLLAAFSMEDVTQEVILSMDDLDMIAQCERESEAPVFALSPY